MFFDKLHKITANFQSLTIGNVMLEVWADEDLQEFIIELNTRKQLFDKGIDSTGADLGEYRPFTIKKKRADGLPFDRVTLFQEGDFYRSFEVKPTLEGFEIDADSVKEGKDLRDIYGENIIGLTAESRDALIKKAISNIVAEILYRVKK